MTTLRVLLHIAAQRDYELHSLDFSTAFLQGSLHEQIWLCRPPRFIWHDTLRTTLAALEFFVSSADPSLFVRRGLTLFIVQVYVDDLVFATPDRHPLASMKEKPQRRHTCTDLGQLQRYLGLQITRNRAARTIMLTQSHMVEQILTRFCFSFSKVQLTPLAVDHGLTAPPSDEPFESSGPYPEMLGCLMYLMTCTRPDLAYPLSVLARFVAPRRHRPSHWYAAKRFSAVLRGGEYRVGRLIPGEVTGTGEEAALAGTGGAAGAVLCGSVRSCVFLRGGGSLRCCGAAGGGFQRVGRRIQVVGAALIGTGGAAGDVRFYVILCGSILFRWGGIFGWGGGLQVRERERLGLRWCGARAARAAACPFERVAARAAVRAVARGCSCGCMRVCVPLREWPCVRLRLHAATATATAARGCGYAYGFFPPHPPESSLTVLHDPLSDYLRASHPVVSRDLSALVTHPIAPLSSVSALVTTVAGFASSHRLDYAAHLVCGPAHSPSSWGAPLFPLEALEDRQFELCFLAAAVPHLCAMLLAPEGDPDALDIPIPRNHVEAVSGPWASYWISAEEPKMASYRSTGTYVDTVLSPRTNVVSGMWLYKVKLLESEGLGFES
ncbi:unnamed protein product [Closterium sp. NIES-53]